MTYLQDQQLDLEVLQGLILGVIVQEIFNNKLQGFQPNFGIEFHDFSMIIPEIFPFFQGTSTE